MFSYLQNNLNTAKTAKDLHVPANTVGLRVRKAEELLHVSLANTESLIHFGMALMADQVVQVSTGSPRPSGANGAAQL
ncbi:helix-turn-helix domain-containing protein [Arthrobacter sp. NPDC058130]|uniref:helix-turn-helix domain-containing protein n=1 Tax=Arthrobacter sp. NPDC058130 TaxID=3346353 RepID=UPI0036E17800